MNFFKTFSAETLESAFCDLWGEPMDFKTKKDAIDEIQELSDNERECLMSFLSNEYIIL